jgi:hypothetical protein
MQHLRIQQGSPQYVYSPGIVTIMMHDYDCYDDYDMDMVHVYFLEQQVIGAVLVIASGTPVRGTPVLLSLLF